MKRKNQIFIYIIFTIISIFCLYMIYIGANGLALSPRKAVFEIKAGETLKLDPGYYFKGVTNPDKVKIDFSKVKTDKPGTYQIKAKQSGRIYTFSIKVTK